jgi:hypothetical protein
MIAPGQVLERFGSQQNALAAFVDELNSRTPNFELKTHIGGYIQDWVDLGRSTNHLFAKHPDLMQVSIHTYVVGRDSAQAEAVFTPNTESGDPALQAKCRFLNFLLNERNEYLGGPCRECSRYFVRKTKRRRSIYCGQKCGRKASSREAARKRRESGRDKLLKTLKAEIDTAKFTSDWKQRIVRKDPDITLNFITRALNSGKVRAPTRKRNAMPRRA